ncbi:RluA family pseudouridine synthase [Effusibacillus pohliae]|uniref:RluA family pseudouridine synthase n=1 Tax=Effusibacillus pohliae TaxID=232270 RepID=UPI00036F88FC|nr:RluA family pseudouridine synthase [Effusibacillus pohliae]
MVDDRLQEIAALCVQPEDDGKMVRQLIRDRLGISRSLLRKIVAAQGVRVNGQPVYITWRVRAGDELRLLGLPECSEFILPEEMPLEIVYEDADLAVVNKPAGLVVHPTKGYTAGTLANGMVHHWRQAGETARFRPVHRLDKNTTGLLVIGKNQFAHQKLSEQLRQRLFRREYLAVVHGNLQRQKLTIEAPILKKQGDPQRIVAEQGQPAITFVTVEQQLANATVIRLQLETGRTHQIRVHMRHIGHPLFGDDLYGIGQPDGIGRQALHAAVLGFRHPRDGRWVEWEAEMPEDMRQLIERLQTG